MGREKESEDAGVSHDGEETQSHAPQSSFPESRIIEGAPNDKVGGEVADNNSNSVAMHIMSEPSALRTCSINKHPMAKIIYRQMDELKSSPLGSSPKVQIEVQTLLVQIEDLKSRMTTMISQRSLVDLPELSRSLDPHTVVAVSSRQSQPQVT